jgi:hypothetical protein
MELRWYLTHFQFETNSFFVSECVATRIHTANNSVHLDRIVIVP